jgi:hypothetical protein
VPAAVLVRPSSAKPLHAQGPSVRQPPTGAPLSLPVPPPSLLPVLLARVCPLHAEQPSSSSILPFHFNFSPSPWPCELSFPAIAELRRDTRPRST